MGSHLNDLRSLMAHLREVCPTLYPVKVRIRKDIAKDAFGGCDLVKPRNGGEPYFSINICASLSWPVAIHFIVHEYAHALSWAPDHPYCDEHPPEMGIQWAKVYSHVFNT